VRAIGLSQHPWWERKENVMREPRVTPLEAPVLPLPDPDKAKDQRTDAEGQKVAVAVEGYELDVLNSVLDS
jgi:hypothetical protein